MRLSDFQVLSFDCYGTLIAWEAGLTAALQPLADRSGHAPAALLERFGPLEHAAEKEQPSLKYSALLELVHGRLAEEVGAAADPDAARRFGASVGDWPAFPDVPEALRYLKQHFRLVILSNVDRASFAHSNERLGVEFDFVFTAEEIGSYKPDVRNFRYMLDRLREAGLDGSRLLHVAQSLFHDHAPANRLGLPSAWIDRRAGKTGAGATPVPESMPQFDFRFTSLGALAEAHRAELA